MRPTSLLIPIALAVLAGPAVGQPPQKEAKPKPPPDEFRAILKEIEEAYKAPLEADEDILDELRKQYKNPTPEREAKLFYEVRRLYATTPEQEEAILREVRRAYVEQSPVQEARLFKLLDRVERLPLGMVHPTTQAELGVKLFSRFDQNGDGVLRGDEVPEAMRAQFARADRNRDGVISPDEYTGHYQTHVKVVTAGVASGEIPIKLPKGVTGPTPMPGAGGPRPAAVKPPELPAWFAEYDMDRDGQVTLYEWRRKGRAIADFLPMDQNGDSYLTSRELRAFLAAQPRPEPTTGKPKGKVPEKKQ